MTSMLIAAAKGGMISQVDLWGLFSSQVGRISGRRHSLPGSELGERNGTRPFKTCQSIVKHLAFIIKKQSS